MDILRKMSHLTRNSELKCTDKNVNIKFIFMKLKTKIAI